MKLLPWNMISDSNSEEEDRHIKTKGPSHPGGVIDHMHSEAAPS